MLHIHKITKNKKFVIKNNNKRRENMETAQHKWL